MIKSIEKAFNIIDKIYNNHNNEIGLLELSRLMKLNKATTFNIVDTLLKIHVLEKNSSNGKYRIGKKIFDFTYGFQFNNYLSNMLKPLCDQMVKKTEESVSIVIYENFQCIPVCRILYNRAVTTKPVIDKIFYKTASGRCILAQLDDVKIKKIIDIYGYPQNDWNNTNDWNTLKQTLINIKKNKISTIINKNSEIAAMGITIETQKKFPPMSIGFFLPKYRFSKTKKQLILNTLQEYSKKISVLNP